MTESPHETPPAVAEPGAPLGPEDTDAGPEGRYPDPDEYAGAQGGGEAADPGEGDGADGPDAPATPAPEPPGFPELPELPDEPREPVDSM